jgi:hypothetical protein
MSFMKASLSRYRVTQERDPPRPATRRRLSARDVCAQKAHRRRFCATGGSERTEGRAVRCSRVARSLHRSLA